MMKLTQRETEFLLAVRPPTMHPYDTDRRASLLANFRLRFRGRRVSEQRLVRECQQLHRKKRREETKQHYRIMVDGVIVWHGTHRPKVLIMPVRGS